MLPGSPRMECHMPVTVGRREFITQLGSAVAWPLAARAQQGLRDKQIQIGFLAAAVPTTAMLRAFRDALREHGYVEGQNLSITDHWPQGSSEQISDIAAELVRSNVDIIVAWTRRGPCPPGLRTRPGGNITGFVNLAPRLEFFPA